MKSEIVITLVMLQLVFLPRISVAQNRVVNGGFEIRANGSSSSKPDHTAQVKHADSWIDQRCCFVGESTVTGQEHSCGLQLHSPDWWSTDIVELGTHDSYKFPFRQQKIPSSSELTVVYPASGIHYVGMGSGELFQQQFTTVNELEPGRTFYLTFKLRLLGSRGQYVQHSHTVSFSSAYLKVFLSVKKLQYKNNDYVPGLSETEEYWEKKDAFDQHIIEIASISLSPQHYPYPHDEWHDVAIEFIAPENWTVFNVSHDWISFELQSDWRAYVFIDDIALMECPPTDACSATYGEIWPTFSGSHNANEPWRIDAITNATRLELEIWPINGSKITEIVTCDHGFPNGWQWSGKNSAGSEFAAGTYLYDLRAKNECGEARFTGNFSKVNGSNNSTIPVEEGCGGVSYVEPIPCCERDPVMYLDGHHWVNQNLHFHATEEIIVASSEPVTVGHQSTVIMRAGERIELNPGFSTDGHDLFIAEIVPCGGDEPPPGPSAKLSGEDDWEEDELENAQTHQLEIPAVLFPNPTTGLLNLHHPQTIAYMEAFDTYGRSVARTMPTGNNGTLDLSGNAAGIYIVRATLEDGSTETYRAVLAPQ